MEKIYRRAMLFSTFLVVLLITIFIITISHDKKSILDEKTSAHRSLLRNSFDLAMLDTEKELNYFAYKISSNREIVDAFAEHDRNKLYRLVLPYFTEAKSKDEVHTSGFIGVDGVHFLRMQDPEKYGDNILHKRPVLAYAIKTRKPITTLDVTLFDVALVTIIPIFKDNQFIGIFQGVANINRIQTRLNRHSGIKSAIVFNTKKLQNILPDVTQIHYRDYSLVSSNDALFEKLPSTFTFNESKRYTIDNRTYIIASRPLTNFQNEIVAMMTCAFDITDHVTSYNQELRNLLIISLVVLIVLEVILYYGFRILIRRIDRDAQITRELNRQLVHQLHTDNLTSCPNRNALIRDIQNSRFYALILLNIDNFKEINDFYSHSIGDEILLALTQSIQEAIQDLPMQLYKMPSDEYAILLNEPLAYTDFDAARTSIIEHLQSKYYEVHGATIFITFTVGADIALQNKGERNLLSNADMALKAAKKRHLSYMVYDESMQIKEEYHNNLLWSKKVKEAIEENRFCLYYQPIIDPKNGSVVEYEALLRMRNGDDTVIAPSYFLPAAKQSRLYAHLTQFVVNEVFIMLATTPHTFSINLSVDDILDTHIRTFILHKLQTSLYNDRLIFELLESEGIENYSEVSSFITDVKKFGCLIAIDDFGTGYSNFAHILRLDVDILKIDGSLIRNIDTDTNAQTILTAVSEFSKHLGLKTVAEFVHSEAVYTKCLELNIDYLQGYYLGEPKPL
ncbi:MAG: EAL domain-containing protein [Sulfuricurvum sp.]|nr:EAL domain-containing protein [Sulfuricurvum sp.]